MSIRRTISLLLLAVTITQGLAQISVRAFHYNGAPEGNPLQQFSVRVQVRPPQGAPYEWSQNCSGTCTFDNIPIGSALSFTAEKTDDPRYSINTGDLVLISSHINGIDTFDNPDHRIAADVDCNDLIEGKDIVVLRRLILRIDTTLCYPWRLVNDAVLLPNQPFQQELPEKIDIPRYDGRPLRLTFRAIKIGNVNSYPPERQATPLPKEDILFGPYPNPTSGESFFTLQLTAATSAEIHVFDAAGKEIYHDQRYAQEGAQQITVPASALPASGVYFWKIAAGNQIRSGKLVRY